MKSDSVRLNPTKDTLEQIVREAVPILNVLGFEVKGKKTSKVQTKSINNLDQLVQKMQISDMDPFVLWK